jgi:hypothetical protein
MRKPVLRFFEGALATDKAERDAIVANIGNPFSKIATELEQDELPNNDYQKFMGSVNSVLKEALPVLTSDGNGMAKTARLPVKIALQSAKTGIAGEDFDHIVDLLVWAWGCGGDSGNSYNKSDSSFARTSDKANAGILAEKLFTFLIKKGLLIDTVGSTGSLGNKLIGSLQSVIWNQPKEATPPPQQEQPPAAPQGPPPAPQ